MLNLGPYKTLFCDSELKRIVLASILPRLPAGTEYVGRLSRMLGDRAHGDFGRTNRELAYFLARTGQAIGSAKEQ